jgi:hypothetical protein
MRMRVHIECLLAEGIRLTTAEQRMLPAIVERELLRLAAPSNEHSTRAPGPSAAATLTRTYVAAGTDLRAHGRQIAAAVYGAVAHGEGGRRASGRGNGGSRAQ